jgi:hypothetical protein
VSNKTPNSVKTRPNSERTTPKTISTTADSVTLPGRIPRSGCIASPLEGAGEDDSGGSDGGSMAGVYASHRDRSY